ncbi:BTB/POZ domain-containing protein At2g24240-like [Papaver somniferum]|uniref:BTB/POZ domain-containing protein At2g24240-like n=1 Tax=Papaver somniferum TaxID=3469 RepID=UPI000E6FFB55|nr:BTB/POZ domain-containing protein At2g24240-like [Papaver somniferum]
MGIQTDKVRFNVGGKIFETTATTLANAGRNSMFGAMFDDQWKLRPGEVNEEYFIDPDPKCFSVLLNLLRTVKLHVPLNMPEKFVYEEALYYGLLENVKAAKWGRFDGNKLELKSSVKGPPPHDCTAIRASPDGGCAVAHGSIVDVYNWILEEQQPLNLNSGKVNDIAWVDSENIVVTANQKLGDGYGGMGLFSSSTGDLKHRYKVKTNTVGALCFNSGSKIFACYGGTGSEDGIGVWDQVTGKKIDYFNARIGWPLGSADKIQWLNGSNCLLVSVLFQRSDQRHISLLDFRDGRMVWSWSRQFNRTEQVIYDAIAMKENNLFAWLMNMTIWVSWIGEVPVVALDGTLEIKKTETMYDLIIIIIIIIRLLINSLKYPIPNQPPHLSKDARITANTPIVKLCKGNHFQFSLCQQKLKVLLGLV